MSNFRGFIPESKSFMGYNKMSFLQRLCFWVRVPIAYCRFVFAARTKP